MNNLESNFHKAHLPERERRYCLGDQKLNLILNEIRNNGDLPQDTTILIPFGGPGSIAHFFDYNGISTISGDIEHIKTYSNPYKNIKNFRGKYNYNSDIAQQDFVAWDATRLPIKRNSQSLAIVNPPYGVNCDLNGDPIELSIGSLRELSEVLQEGGVAYYVFPKDWIHDFLEKAKKFGQMSSKVLYENISDNPTSKLPLCLIRIEKNQTQ